MIDLQKALAELEQIVHMDQLSSFFQTYLGKQGSLTLAFKTMGDLSPEEKKEFGKQLTEIKTSLTSAYEIKEHALMLEEINTQLKNDIVDSSIESAPLERGHLSLLTKTRREAEDICRSMGFIIETGTEVVTKFENFESVNIPLTHPATEMQDTIYLDDEDAHGEKLILRTQTSALQNFIIKKYGIPLKAVMPGKVYRYENMDATHDTMFYQLEGIIIDKGLSVAHFKGLMTELLEAILKTKVETRMRP